jgi:tetratricopeptide (TPR) repeat protein
MIKKLLSAAAAVALFPAPAHAEWVEASSKHFLVYGDMSEAQARTWAERLERINEFLRDTAGVKDDAEAVGRVTIYVVPSMDAVQRLAGRMNVGGFYRRDVQGDLAVTPRFIPSQYRMKPQEVLFHEYTHHILIRSETGAVPAWVHEGFAEFFSTIYTDDAGNLIVGAPPESRGYALAQQYRMTLDELLTSSDRKLSDAERPHMYARGWLLLHYLTMSKKRPGQLGKYLSLLKRGTPSLEAGKQAFGDLAQLDSELGAYLKNGRFPAAKIPAGQFAVGPIQSRVLRPCEARIMPVRIRSAVGVTAKTAPDVAAAARREAAGCENDPFVQRTLAETEFDAKNDAASMAAADRTLALDPNNIMALVYKGRVYARQGNWAEARRWFVKANRLDTNYALPLVLYYDSFVRAGQKPTDPALKGLFRAAMIVPQDPSVRLRVVRALLVEGDVEGARTVLAPFAYAPHQNAGSAPRRILKMLEAGADAKTVLAAADKEKWNEIGKE